MRSELTFQKFVRHIGEDESTKPVTQTTEEAPLLQQLQLAEQEVVSGLSYGNVGLFCV